jgi:immune inhibitor A
MLPVMALAETAGEIPEVPPPGRNLTETEARLWVEQGVDKAANHLLGLAEARATGLVTELKAAVLLVDFPDLPADTVAHPPEYYETLMFSQGVLPGKSVAEYLSISSRGRLQLTGEVRGWFTVSEERNHYTNEMGGIGWYPQNSQRLVEEAIWLADPTINYALFDDEGPDNVPDSGDDDEIIDAVIVVHAGPGRESGGTTANDFISVHWWTPAPFPTDGVFGRFFTLNPEDGSIGILIHELGHLLGLPDLYDTDGGSFGIGRWSMMAGGFLLDQGASPADFDAWSKIKLGFTDVAAPGVNMKGLIIPPTIESGLVHRLWNQGVSSVEYFLLENRQQSGLDHALPGSGLVIYHVDETIKHNKLPNHYKVAVEQADGLFQLENRFNDASIGDEGDPFKAGEAFGRYTIPSSLSYNGSGTFVHVFNITGPDATGAMTADVSVQPGPLVEVVDLNLTELSGNGDGLMQPGEMIGIAPSLAVSRRQATGLVLRARSLDPLGELLDTERQIGTVSAGQTHTLTTPLRVVIGNDVPTDPYGIPMELEVAWDDAPGRRIPVELGIGTVVGRQDDFESADHGWTAHPVRPTAINQWHRGPDFGRHGSAGFKYGSDSGGYIKGSDAVLLSPPTLLPPDAALFFDQLVDIQNPDSTLVTAGGVIEVSANGGDWQIAVPDGDYPAHFRGGHLEWFGRRMYSGRYLEGEYHTVRVDLSAYSGSIRVRFRFFAESDTRVGQGWMIDNVRVLQDQTPVHVLSMESSVEGVDVHLFWRLAEPFPSSLRMIRGPDPDHAVPIGGWIVPAEEGSVVDGGGVEHLPADYWLEVLERDGTHSYGGPLRVASVPITIPWRILANPSRGNTRFSWTGELPERAVLEIFDVSGRLVFDSSLSGAPGTFAWDGRDRSGRSVKPGIYFARVRDTNLSPLRVVRLP